MTEEQVDIKVVPRLPVSLRTPKGRFRADVEFERATYSCTAQTPGEALKGAAMTLDFMEGVEIELPEYIEPPHPIVMDAKIVWEVTKIFGKIIIRKTKKIFEN